MAIFRPSPVLRRAVLTRLAGQKPAPGPGRSVPPALPWWFTSHRTPDCVRANVLGPGQHLRHHEVLHPDNCSKTLRSMTTVTPPCDCHHLAASLVTFEAAYSSQ